MDEPMARPFVCLFGDKIRLLSKGGNYITLDAPGAQHPHCTMQESSLLNNSLIVWARSLESPGLPLSG